ncbi:glycosyltransferase family 4 protein [Flavobacteriales bacterium]|nr:glycosyltransferase family 4 protein [Flavobacteriales bacterium]
MTTLQEVSDVVALCGAPALGERNPDVHYGRFATRPLRVHHTLIRKMTGRDVRLSAQRSCCQREVDDALGRAQPDFIWVEFATTAWLAKTTLEEMGAPYFLNVHGYDITRAFASEEYKEGFVGLANRSAGVICASHHTRMLCQSAGVLADRLHMVRLAIDASRFPQSLNKTEQPSFVHFGRLTGKKGPLITLEAFALVQRQYPKAMMTFIGSGPLESELRSRVARLGLEKSVRLIPAQRWQDGLMEVSRHWVFCQHSITHIDGDQEGFALSPAEAAMMGMPVVSTYHNGIPEHVMDGVSGFLVREHDFESMAERMIRLIEDPQLRMEMGQRGRENILAMCDPERRRQAILELIKIKTVQHG